MAGLAHRDTAVRQASNLHDVHGDAWHQGEVASLRADQAALATAREPPMPTRCACWSSARSRCPPPFRSRSFCWLCWSAADSSWI